MVAARKNCAIFVLLLSGCLLDPLSIFQNIESTLNSMDQSLNTVLELEDLQDVSKNRKYFAYESYVDHIRSLDRSLEPESDTMILVSASGNDCVLPRSTTTSCTLLAGKTTLELEFPAGATALGQATVTGHLYKDSSDTHQRALTILGETVDTNHPVDLWRNPVVALFSVTNTTGEQPVTSSTAIAVDFRGCPDVYSGSALCDGRSDRTDRFWQFTVYEASSAATEWSRLGAQPPITDEANITQVTASYTNFKWLPDESSVDFIEIRSTYDLATSSGSAIARTSFRDGLTGGTNVQVTEQQIRVLHKTQHGRSTNTWIDRQTFAFTRTTVFEPGDGIREQRDSGSLESTAIEVSRIQKFASGKVIRIRVDATHKDGVSRGIFSNSSGNVTGYVQIRSIAVGRKIDATIYEPLDQTTLIDGVSADAGGFSANFWSNLPDTSCDLAPAIAGDQSVVGAVRRGPRGTATGEVKYCTDSLSDVRYATVKKTPGKPPRLIPAGGTPSNDFGQVLGGDPTSRD